MAQRAHKRNWTGGSARRVISAHNANYYHIVHFYVNFFHVLRFLTFGSTFITYGHRGLVAAGVRTDWSELFLWS